MIQLDYQTYNPRWGWSGIVYSNWECYAFALGYLANLQHYRNAGGLVEVHIEQNDEQGAWGREGRIHYYGLDIYLENNFPDWYRCKSAGNGSISCRINSNSYIYSLAEDYGFAVKTYQGYTTADIFPPEINAYRTVWNCLLSFLQRESFENIDTIFAAYDAGWRL